MVNTKKKEIIEQQPDIKVKEIDLPDDEVKWCSVALSEVLNNDNRLEASVFKIEAKQARDLLQQSKYPLKVLYGQDGFFEYANNSCRFKRDYKNKSSESVGFLGSSEILDVYPKAEKYISKVQAVQKGLIAKLNEVLISCSGTIGNISLVSQTMSNNALSQHMIRAYTKDYYGYIYAFLKTNIGQILIKTNTYGSVVQHIEPKHLEYIYIPNPPEILKKEIHNLVVKSYNLRDESNDLIDEAEKMLIEELKLPPIEDFKPKYFDNEKGIRNFEVSLSRLNNRFDGSYHIPLVDCIKEHLQKYAETVTNIGDKNVSEEIILPGRFARTYVEEGQGTLFFGGKELNQLEPSNKKYLSVSVHNNRIEKELKLKENMILVTRSGTIGRINIVPHHWENWVINEHVIRIKPISKDIAGYLYCWLNTEYGEALIKRYTYGSVVDEIDTNHVANIILPLPKNKEIQTKINNLVLEANKKRYEAYVLEQKAIKMVNEKVIYAK
mgnify:CR=1 FL=1